MATTINLGKILPTFAGAFSVSETYPRFTVVEYEGSSYISKIASRGVTPGTDTSVWIMLAQAGSDGNDGTSFTYEDLTEAQKEELAQSAKEQAEIATQALADILSAISNLDPSTSTSDAVTALAAQLQASNTRTAAFKGTVSDIDSLNSSSDFGTYYYAGTSAAKGLVTVSYDNSGNVTQTFQSSSTPDYSGGSLDWVAGPSVIYRTYASGSWSQWKASSKFVLESGSTSYSDF